MRLVTASQQCCLTVRISRHNDATVKIPITKGYTIRYRACEQAHPLLDSPITSNQGLQAAGVTVMLWAICRGVELADATAVNISISNKGQCTLPTPGGFYTRSAQCC
jgi:hypothetical protein